MAKQAFEKKAEASIKDRTLIEVRRFKASREKIFDAWTDAKQVAKWMGPKGFTIPVAKLEPREGGKYAITMNSPAGSAYTVGGTYCELVRPSRLVFTWAWQQPEGHGPVTCVTLEFRPAGKGSELRFHHALFEDKAGRDSHRGGWREALDKLSLHASGKTVK